jgi:Reverse transcriptase (RNA-dependent DNA polymerase)
MDIKKKNHPKSTHFRAAAHKEMRALLSKDTWEEVQKSPQTKTHPTKWVFLYKEDADGYVTKFKARLCARGDLQLGVNKQDVAAITGAYRTFRLLMALVAAFDLDVIQLNAVNAFINADRKGYLFETPKGPVWAPKSNPPSCAR